ncbi:unnamed protein product [Acanthoscelides obtectus]|uniref:Uncharacterized protein n=1 Tax=Acanthoscelides obtectus TaxID=200917 RepID=A0A9P0NV76_ACAOB|nr:unnamed protein product [Acanthoscelides obtectus]CAK1621165.1 hypothetical protein AOBTE_LOCUS802 [Acanthoscelides obtectus]
MQTAAIVYKMETKEYRGAIVSSSTSSPPSVGHMRPPPPPPPPKVKPPPMESRLEEPSSSIPDLGELLFLEHIFISVYRVVRSKCTS